MLIVEGILLFLWALYLFETYLDFRQRRKLKELSIPHELKDYLTLENCKKSQGYNLDKNLFGLVRGAFSQVERTLRLFFGFLPFMWGVSLRLASNWGYSEEDEIVVSLTFLFLISLVDNFIAIPFNLYQTFVIEEKHGFNKQTLVLFFTDVMKTMAISMILGYPLTASIIWIIKWGGPQFYIYVWLSIFLFSMFLLTIYPNFIAPLFNKFTPLEEGELKTQIEALAAKLNFPLTKIFIVDGSKRSAHSNAYFYGFFKNKRIVIFDTLLKHVQGNNKEILGILCHELGHWQFSHTVKLLMVSQFQIFTYFFLYGKVMYWEEMYSSFGFSSQPTIIGLLIFFEFLMAPVGHLLGFLLNIVSRHFEFQADEFATSMSMGPELRSGLLKIHIENLSDFEPDPWYTAYHFSHPPLLERLRAIDKKLK